MNGKVKSILNGTLSRYPELKKIEDNMIESFEMIVASYRQGGKVLICGNGGSAADADHIVGELMKGFLKKRPISPALKERLRFAGMGNDEADYLQAGLPAISLSAHTSLMTATINDLGGEMIFAQQVLGYGKPEDVFLGISTSGNSRNVLSAAKAAKALGLKTIGLTGSSGGKMAEICDVTIRVPETETYKIQELHLPVYHVLCAMIEEEFFEE